MLAHEEFEKDHSQGKNIGFVGVVFEFRLFRHQTVKKSTRQVKISSFFDVRELEVKRRRPFSESIDQNYSLHILLVADVVWSDISMKSLSFLHQREGLQNFQEAENFLFIAQLRSKISAGRKLIDHFRNLLFSKLIGLVNG